MSAEKACSGRLDRVRLVVTRRSRTGKMPDSVDLLQDRFVDIVTNQLEAGMTDPSENVGFASGVVVIEAAHLLPGFH